jgi:hypothetical protein
MRLPAAPFRLGEQEAETAQRNCRPADLAQPEPAQLQLPSSLTTLFGDPSMASASNIY